MWSDALIIVESKPRVTASITRAAVGQCETDSVAWQSDLRHGGPIMGLLVEETAPVPTSRPKSVSTPRCGHDCRANWGSHRRSTVAEPEVGEVFNKYRCPAGAPA